MAAIEIKHFADPDETRPFVHHGKADVLKFEGGSVGRGTFAVGWKWSEDVKPIEGTELCEASHTCLVVSGRMHVTMHDGEEAELSPGDIAVIPPGHDAWTVGEEDCVLLDFSGMETYALPKGAAAGRGAEQAEEAPASPS